MKRLLVILLLILLVLCAASAFYIYSHPAQPVATAAVADIGGPFALTNQDGQPVTDQSFHGRMMLVEFGYTACPDICPMQLELMRAALNKLGDKAAQIAPVFVTLDPDHDTPAHLQGYLQPYNQASPAITGLTGSMEAIDAMAKSYRIYVQRTPVDGVPGAFMIDHSVTIFLMDSDGHFVQSFTSPTPDELAAGLRDALK